VPFRASFDCLWCGRPATSRPDDIAGWAQLCPDCVGRAGDNAFLRSRLRAALTSRSGAARATEPPSARPATAERGAGPGNPATARTDRSDEIEAETRAYYAARAPEYDDWYLRRGRYSHGPVHDAAWQAELDAAGRWLDSVPIRGEIVELAAGTGWWSPLLAEKGQLSLYDVNEAPLEIARERLLAHGLRAHLHVRDAWAPPDRRVDAVFTGFWLSHVPRGRLDAFLALAREWLAPGGTFAAIDSLPDPNAGAVGRELPVDGRARRRLGDGREFTIVKVHYSAEELRAALLRAGFATAEATTTGRFFVLVNASR
jgi:SAM-dependent methyltransferase